MARQEDLDRAIKEKEDALTKVKRIEEGDDAYCTMCGKILSYKKFYKSITPKLSKNGLMHICSSCLNTYCNNIIEKTDGNYKYAVADTCRLCNIVFDDASYEMMESQRYKATSAGKRFLSPFGVYKSKLSSTANHNGSVGVTFADTVLTETINGSLEEIDNIEELEFFWGEGYDAKAYRFLQKKYDLLLSASEVELESEVMLFKQICLEDLNIRKLRASNNDVTKNLKTLQELMASANIRSTDIKNANANKMINTYSKWIGIVETDEPCEYFKDKTIFEDFDGIGKYWKTHILRPLKNLLSGSKDFEVDM